MTATDIAAWWGGLTGSILFVIELVRFLRESPDYDIAIDYEYDDEFMMRQKPKALKYTIRNTSEHTTTITGVSLDEWMKHPKRWRPMKIRFYSSGILDEYAGKNYPQKLEPGDYIEGRIDAATLRQHAPKSCRPIVMSVSDTRHKRPKRISLRIPKPFVDPLQPLDQLYNQLRLSGDRKHFTQFVNAVAKTIGLKRCNSTTDPSGILHMTFPSPTPVDEAVIRGLAQSHGMVIKSLVINTRLEESG